MKRIVWMAKEYGGYRYRSITGLRRAKGWWVNRKPVKEISHREGLKVPAEQPTPQRLWLEDGFCGGLRPTHRNHIWSYEFVMNRMADSRPFRMLMIVDEFTR